MNKPSDEGRGYILSRMPRQHIIHILRVAAPSNCTFSRDAGNAAFTSLGFPSARVNCFRNVAL
jgi:hypothetical protein